MSQHVADLLRALRPVRALGDLVPEHGLPQLVSRPGEVDLVDVGRHRGMLGRPSPHELAAVLQHDAADVEQEAARGRGRGMHERIVAVGGSRDN